MAKHRRPTTAWSKQTPSSKRTLRPSTMQVQVTRPLQSTTNETPQAATSVSGNYSIDGNQDEVSLLPQGSSHLFTRIVIDLGNKRVSFIRSKAKLFVEA